MAMYFSTTASGRTTLSREQFTKVQEICDDITATNEDTTVQLDAGSESYLNTTMDFVTSSEDLQEDGEGVDDGESYSGVDHESDVPTSSVEISSSLGPNDGKLHSLVCVVYLTCLSM